MIKINKLNVILISLALSACGGGQDDSSASQPAAASGESSAGHSPAAAPAEEMASGVIDHSRDVMEFELRRALGGVERMIEQYTADGYDTAELEARKAELMAELENL